MEKKEDSGVDHGRSLVQIARKLNNKTNDESSNTENWTTEEVMELLCSATHILNDELSKASCSSSFFRFYHSFVTEALLGEKMTGDWLPCMSEENIERHYDIFFFQTPLAPHSLIALCSHLKQLGREEGKKAIQIEQSLTLLERFIKGKYVTEALKTLSPSSQSSSPSPSSSSSLPLVQQFISCLISIPEIVNNCTKGGRVGGSGRGRSAIPVPSSLSVPSKFFSIVLNEILSPTLLSSSSPCSIFPSLISEILSRLCIIGQKEFVGKHLLIFLNETNSEETSSEVSRQMSDQILSHLSPQILEPLLLSILHQSSLPSSPSTPPIMDLLLWIFSPLLLSPTTHKHAHSLIVHRFLTEITLSEDVRKGISDALCFFPDPLPVPSRKSVEEGMKLLKSPTDRNHPSKLLLEAFLHTVRVWSDHQFVRTASSGPRHQHITSFILLFLDKVNGETIEDIQFLSPLLEGVQIHLQSPIKKVRKWGKEVGEKFSLVLDPTRPLCFDDEEDDSLPSSSSSSSSSSSPSSSSSLSSASSPPSSSSALTTAPSSSKIQKNKKKSEKASLFDAETPFWGEEDEEDEDDDTDEEDDYEDDEEDEEDEYEYGEEDEDEEEWEEDLPTFGLEENEEDSKKSKKPRRLRECLACFRKKDDPNAVEGGLDVVGELVNSRPLGLHDVSVTLIEALLHLSDEYNLPNFEEKRMEGMVALCCNSAQLVVPYLTEQFYERNYSIRHRLDILSALTQAAEFLSSSTVSSPPVSSLIEEVGEEKVVVEKNEGATRRWGYAKHPQAPKATSVNPFLEVAGLFFYPLLSRFECPSISFKVMDEDGVILAKLAYTAGVIIKCASTHPDISYLFSTQVDFLLYISNHKEAFVRRASLYSLLCVISPFPFLISHLSFSEISKVKDWIEGAQDDIDPDCQILSSHVASIFQKQLN